MKSLSLPLGIFAALLASPPASSQGTRVPDTHAIVNGKIVLGDGTTLDKVTIVIRDGRIERVDASGAPPADALVFDATGLTVYPGFVDAWVPAGLRPADTVNEGPPADPTAAASATMRETHRKGIRPDLTAVEALDPPDDVVNPRKQAGFTFSFFAPTPAILGGRASVADLSGSARRDALVRADAAMVAELRPPGGEGYPGSLMGAIAQFRQALYDADWYRKSWKVHRDHPGQVKAPPTDPILAAMEPILDKGMPVVFVANTRQEILRCVKVAEELNLRPWIAGGTEAWECASVLTQKQIPVLLSLDFGAEPKDPKEPADRRRTETATASAPDSGPASKAAERWPNPDELSPRVRAERQRRYAERVSNAAALVKAGVKIALTTAGLRNPGEFHGALNKAVEKGLTREAALAALTTQSAEILGVADSAGRIAPGRRAALTIVKGTLGDKDLKVRAIFLGNKRFDYDDDGAEAPASTPAGGRRRPREDSDDGDTPSGSAKGGVQ